MKTVRIIAGIILFVAIIFANITTYNLITLKGKAIILSQYEDIKLSKYNANHVYIQTYKDLKDDRLFEKQVDIDEYVKSSVGDIKEYDKFKDLQMSAWMIIPFLISGFTALGLLILVIGSIVLFISWIFTGKFGD